MRLECTYEEDVVERDVLRSLVLFSRVRFQYYGNNIISGSPGENHHA